MRGCSQRLSLKGSAVVTTTFFHYMTLKWSAAKQIFFSFQFCRGPTLNFRPSAISDESGGIRLGMQQVVFQLSIVQYCAAHAISQDCTECQSLQLLRTQPRFRIDAEE